MQAIELIRWALDMTHQGTKRIVADMRDAPLTQPTSRGGNHPLWVLGHLAFTEGGIFQLLTDEPNPVGDWASLFAPGTQPSTDASVYPSFDEVLEKYEKLRAKNILLLNALGDARLDEAPVAIPPGFEDAMKTKGRTLLLLALHNMVHYGQIADARRAAGYSPLV